MSVLHAGMNQGAYESSGAAERHPCAPARASNEGNGAGDEFKNAWPTRSYTNTCARGWRVGCGEWRAGRGRTRDQQPRERAHLRVSVARCLEVRLELPASRWVREANMVVLRAEVPL